MAKEESVCTCPECLLDYQEREWDRKDVEENVPPSVLD